MTQKNIESWTCFRVWENEMWFTHSLDATRFPWYLKKYQPALRNPVTFFDLLWLSEAKLLISPRSYDFTQVQKIPFNPVPDYYLISTAFNIFIRQLQLGLRYNSCTLVPRFNQLTLRSYLFYAVCLNKFKSICMSVKYMHLLKWKCILLIPTTVLDLWMIFVIRGFWIVCLRKTQDQNVPAQSNMIWYYGVTHSTLFLVLKRIFNRLLAKKPLLY